MGYVLDNDVVGECFYVGLRSNVILLIFLVF